MKTASLLAFLIVAAILGSGCVMTSASRTYVPVYWTTMEPTLVVPTEQLVAAGPFHLYHRDSLGIVNLDEHYNGDDTPWIDRTEDFRETIADVMHGYDPASITLADVAHGRYDFLRDRLGDNFEVKEKGRNGEELSLLSGTKWETERVRYSPGEKIIYFPGTTFGGKSKYSSIRTMMYRKVFSEYKDAAKGDLTIQVVSDAYPAIQDAPHAFDMSIYLLGLQDGDEKPVPKATYTVIVDKLVRKIAIEGTERSVPGGTAIDVETPRGRFTVYRASYVDDSDWRLRWRYWQDVWYIGQALVKLLNTIPVERLPGQQEGEK